MFTPQNSPWSEFWSEFPPFTGMGVVPAPSTKVFAFCTMAALWLKVGAFKVVLCCWPLTRAGVYHMKPRVRSKVCWSSSTQHSSRYCYCARYVAAECETTPPYRATPSLTLSDFGEFFVVSVSWETKHEKNSKNSGENSAENPGRKFEKFGELSCDMSQKPRSNCSENNCSDDPFYSGASSPL